MQFLCCDGTDRSKNLQDIAKQIGSPSSQRSKPQSAIVYSCLFDRLSSKRSSPIAHDPQQHNNKGVNTSDSSNHK